MPLISHIVRRAHSIKKNMGIDPPLMELEQQCVKVSVLMNELKKYEGFNLIRNKRVEDNRKIIT